MERRKPFPHQIVGANYIAEKRRCGLWWEPRTGKTLTSLLGCRKAGAETLIVVAPPSIHLQWQREAQLEGYDLQIHGKRGSAGKHGLIVSYESIWRKGVIQDVSLFDAIIFDESIRMQSWRSKRAEWLHDNIYDLPDIRILLSGAPCPESPLQVMHQLYIAQGSEFPWDSFFHYLRDHWRYDEYSYKWKPRKGADVAAKQYMMNHGMAMTQKELGFGNHKFYDFIELKASPIEQKVWNHIMDCEKYTRDGETKDMTPMTRAQFLQAVGAGVNPLEQKVIADTKIDGVVQWVQDLIESEPDAQVVIFAKHTGIQKRLVLAFTEAKVDVFHMDGSTPSVTRQHMVDDFHKRKYTAGVIQCRVGEVGLDLSCANYIVYLENTWSGNTRIQSEERCTNINKQTPICVYDVCMVFEGDVSIDREIATAVRGKKDANDVLLINALRGQNAKQISGL